MTTIRLLTNRGLYLNSDWPGVRSAVTVADFAVTARMPHLQTIILHSALRLYEGGEEKVQLGDIVHKIQDVLPKVKITVQDLLQLD